MKTGGREGGLTNSDNASREKSSLLIRLDWKNENANLFKENYGF